MERGSRIAVIGVGAIGGSVAADLADLGRHEIQLCGRSAFDELTVRHPHGVSRIAAALATSPAEIHPSTSPADWILLATKAHQSVAAQPWLTALCGPATTIAVLQNGVDHVERVQPLAPGNRILPVVVQLPAERTSPGRIEQANTGLLIVPDDDAGLAFADLFSGGRTAVRASDDFATQAWWKLLSNAALGGVCALTLRENGVVADPPVRELVLRLMQEVLEVARAEGATLPDDAPEKALDRMLKGAPNHWSSITVDRRQGRPMEWVARNQVVSLRARRHGIATPLNDMITTLLRAADVVPSSAGESTG